MPNRRRLKINEPTPVFKALNTVVMILLLGVMAVPLWNILVVSFTSDMESFEVEFKLLPREPSVSGYRMLLSSVQLWRPFLNNVFVTVVGTLLFVVTNSLAGFVLIAWLGSTNILLLMAAVLAIASFLAARSGPAIKTAAGALYLILSLIAWGYDAQLRSAGFVDTDTAYNRVMVFKGAESHTGRLMRVMATGPHARQSAMYLDDPSALALPYTRYFRLVEHFVPELRRLLVLGGGGFSFPKYALAHYPDVAVDVVELDPGIIALARDYFELKDHPRQGIIAEDARTFLNRNRKAYDAILCDTFNSHYAIPFHLATVEAAQRMKAALSPNGVVLVNLLSSPDGECSRFFHAMVGTYTAVFPRVLALAVGNPQDPSC